MLIMIWRTLVVKTRRYHLNCYYSLLNQMKIHDKMIRKTISLLYFRTLVDNNVNIIRLPTKRRQILWNEALFQFIATFCFLNSIKTKIIWFYCDTLKILRNFKSTRKRIHLLDPFIVYHYSWKIGTSGR